VVVEVVELPGAVVEVVGATVDEVVDGLPQSLRATDETVLPCESLPEAAWAAAETHAPWFSG
jgi:hypothetical protein